MLFFEGDAWGTTYRQGLEWIIENDQRFNNGINSLSTYVTNY